MCVVYVLSPISLCVIYVFCVKCVCKARVVYVSYTRFASTCILCVLLCREYVRVLSYYDNANNCGDTDGGEDSIEKINCCYDGNDSNNGNDDIDHYKNVGNSISFVCTDVDLIIVLRRQLFYILVYGSATLAFIRLSKIKLIKK